MAKKRSMKSSTSKKMSMTFNHGMGDHSHGMHNCRTWGWVFLVIGILYLLRDFGGVRWWGISWWTVLFILTGLMWLRKE